MVASVLLDLNWTGQARCIATALLRSDNFAALIDPGPGSTLATLRNQLALHRLRVADLNAILLTHIHLDHAGATGALVQENPAIQVYVHARGSAHMSDPSKLLESARRLYREEMQNLFGDFLPVPEGNLRILQGGETLSLGSREFRVLYTPGHASHHVTYFDPTERVAYVGDTAGISIEGHPFILPATPPPDISLELWTTSLENIAQLRPRRLFLTHFGYSDQPERHLNAYGERLRHWVKLSGEILSRGLEQSEAIHAFSRSVAAEAAEFLSPSQLSHYVFNGALQLSWLGLERYHRKRAEAAAKESAG
ncbi:MAG TPA: MBL fold metallo-hydrolase [Candidatus Acidoferrum sp.]|nr:MBL fold metallo-hydrolase [Candidatus Acidoferrum sp.]